MARERGEIAEVVWPSEAAPVVAQTVKSLRATVRALEPWADALPPGLAKINALRRIKQYREIATELEQRVLEQ